MNSSCGVRSKITNSRKSARFSGRSAAAARRRAKSSHFLLLWLPGLPCTQWTKLRGRRCLSTRERTSFVAVPQTENGRVCLGEPTTCLPSRFAMYLRRLKSFFTALFTTGRAVDRALYRCVYRGDRTYGCGDIAFSVGDHRQSWCVPIV